MFRVFCRTAVCAAILLPSTIDDAEARRGGRFVSSFSRGIAHSGSASKTYGPNVLTAAQLVECVRKADQLDGEATLVDTDRQSLQARFVQIDSLKSDIDRSEATINRRSQAAVDRFNAAVTRYNALVNEARSTQSAFNLKVDQHNLSVQTYNAACAKQYYADDLASAKRSLGIDQ
jgi:hypothetical protein